MSLFLDSSSSGQPRDDVDRNLERRQVAEVSE